MLKKSIVALATLGMVLFGLLAQANEPDDYVQQEFDYWVKNTPNDLARYSAVCGVYRHEPDETRPLEVIRVDSVDIKKNEYKGTSADGQVVVSTATNDQSYAVMLAIVNLCGEIQRIISERVGGVMSDGAKTSQGQMYFRRMLGIPSEISIEE